MRRSLGVSEAAETDTNVEPAPPKAENPLPPLEPPSSNPEDFIELKDFKESLQPELSRTFGGPRLKEDKPKHMAFDASKAREEMGEVTEETVEEQVRKHVEL